MWPRWKCGGSLQNCQWRPAKHDLAECCKVSFQCETCQRITGEYLEHITIPVNLCLSCSSMSKINSNIWPRQSWLWSDTILIHVIWSLTIVSNDEIASYTQFQKVSSSVASSSRRKTHSINLEGTGLKGTTTAMLNIHLATNAGWKLFGGHLNTPTNQCYVTCP
jgi:hypothetical protein